MKSQEIKTLENAILEILRESRWHDAAIYSSQLVELTPYCPNAIVGELLAKLGDRQWDGALKSFERMVLFLSREFLLIRFDTNCPEIDHFSPERIVWEEAFAWSLTKEERQFFSTWLPFNLTLTQRNPCLTRWMY